MAVTGGMILRMGVVLAVSLGVFLAVPQFHESSPGTATLKRKLVFWSAVLLSYLGTLAWETVLSARHKTTTQSAGPAPAAATVGE